MASDTQADSMFGGVGYVAIGRWNGRVGVWRAGVFDSALAAEQAFLDYAERRVDVEHGAIEFVRTQAIDAEAAGGAAGVCGVTVDASPTGMRALAAGMTANTALGRQRRQALLFAAAERERLDAALVAAIFKQKNLEARLKAQRSLWRKATEVLQAVLRQGLAGTRVEVEPSDPLLGGSSITRGEHEVVLALPPELAGAADAALWGDCIEQLHALLVCTTGSATRCARGGAVSDAAARSLPA